MVAKFHVGAALLTAALVAAAGSTAVRAQSPDASLGRIWTGVYSADQAAQGETTFASRCARCHASDLSGGQVGAAYAPALGGERFLGAWESRNLSRLFRTIKDTMPRDAPGILNDAGAAEIVAYILKYNGFPAGESTLGTETTALESIAIIPKPGAVKREATNFTTVLATGCLTRGAANGWALTNATDPAVSRADAPVTATSATAGTQTYRLVSTGAFGLDGRAGERVTVKAVIRRDPDETLLNVLAVAPAGSRCN